MKKTKKKLKCKKKYRKPQIKTEKIKFQEAVQCTKTAYSPGCTELLS